MSTKDDLTVAVECPQCGYQIEETLRGLQDNPTVTCRCGTRVRFEGVDATAAALDEVDDAIDDFLGN